MLSVKPRDKDFRVIMENFCGFVQTCHAFLSINMRGFPSLAKLGEAAISHINTSFNPKPVMTCSPKGNDLTRKYILVSRCFYCNMQLLIFLQRASYFLGLNLIFPPLVLFHTWKVIHQLLIFSAQVASRSLPHVIQNRNAFPEPSWPL